MVRNGRRAKAESRDGAERGLKDVWLGGVKTVMTGVGMVESKTGSSTEAEGGACHFYQCALKGLLGFSEVKALSSAWDIFTEKTFIDSAKHEK